LIFLCSAILTFVAPAYGNPEVTKEELGEIKNRLHNKGEELKIITHELERIKGELNEITEKLKNTEVRSETGADPKVIQKALTILGYYDGKLDGDFGPKSKKALHSFQSKEKLESSDQLNSQSCIRLADRISHKKTKKFSNKEISELVSGLLGICRQLAQ
jgi:hypothetical protein